MQKGTSAVVFHVAQVARSASFLAGFFIFRLVHATANELDALRTHDAGLLYLPGHFKG